MRPGFRHPRLPRKRKLPCQPEYCTERDRRPSRHDPERSRTRRDALRRYAKRSSTSDRDSRSPSSATPPASPRALVAAGIQPGDRVAIWAPNISEWVVAALGVYRAGGVIVSVNTRFKGNEATYILNRAHAKLLFTVTDFLDTNYVDLLRGSDPVPSLDTIVVLRGDAPEGTLAWDLFLAAGANVDDREIAAREAATTGDTVSDIIFTSGTTGLPKGAMLTHGASVAAYDAWTTVVGLRHGDRYLIVNPFFHTFGLKAGILACLITGATIVPHAVFDVDSVMQRVVDERISMLPGAPTIYQSILDHPRVDAFDMSTLRLAVTGAAAVPVELIKRMRAELSFETIVTGLRPHRSDGHRDDVPPRRRRRDDRDHCRARDPRGRGARRRRRRQGGRDR